MKVKELIQKLQSFDPELEIGTADEMGNIEEIWNVDLSAQGFVKIRVHRGWYEEPWE